MAAIWTPCSILLRRVTGDEGSVGAANELEPDQGALRSPTVLVVEDEPLIRMLLADILRDANLAVVEAISGDEAWRYVEAGGETDLILTDIHMRGKIDGRRLANLIRQHFPHIIVIVASGNPGPSLGVEFKHFLHKPYDLYRAVGLVLQLLERDALESPDNPPGSN